MDTQEETTTARGQIEVGGYNWAEIEGSTLKFGCDRRSYEPKVKWPGGISPVNGCCHSVIQFIFLRMFPMPHVCEIIELSNIQLKKRGYDELTVAEFFKYIGLRLAMTLEPAGNLYEYWRTERIPGGVVQPKRYNDRFNITRRRFIDELEQCISYGPPATVSDLIAVL